MQFGEILSRAWDIVWRFKVLWIFGIYAGLTAGASNGTSNYRLEQSDIGFVAPALVTLLCVGGLILFFVLLVLNIISYTALSRGAWQADEGARRLTFGELWQAGVQNFWRVAGLLLLETLFWVVLVIALIAPEVQGAVGAAGLLAPDSGFGPEAGVGFGILTLLAVCLCCLLIPVFLVVDAFVWQAVAAIVNDRLTFSDAIGRTWDLFRKNFGQMILMALILVALRLLIGLVLGLLGLIIAIPLGVTAYALNQAFSGGGESILIASLILLPFSLLFNGIVTAYVGTVWTLVYRRLTGRQAETRGSVEVYPQAPAI